MIWLLVPVVVYSVGIFTLWLILRGSRADIPSAAAPLPRVTVVVAARNEERLITTLLDGLSRQDYPTDLLEIIIVNDNSTDRTPIVVSEFIESLRQHSAISIRLIFNPFPGKKRAIRYGIEKSSGELILTTDADCTVRPGWVSAHAAAYSAGSKALTRRRILPESKTVTRRLLGRGALTCLWERSTRGRRGVLSRSLACLSSRHCRR